jgi:orotate phosphoribosyltransferase
LSSFEQLRSEDDESLKARLRELLLKHSILRGEFVLKSGQRSTWFIDVKNTVCRPEGLAIVSLLILRHLPHEVTAIGGQTMGADPIAFGTAGVATSLGRAIRSFSIRKEAKDHGPGGMIAGVLSETDNAILVEDASSRGTSTLSAASAVRAAGAKVALAIAVVDRGGTAKQLLEQNGIEFRALLSAPDLGLPFEGGLT